MTDIAYADALRVISALLYQYDPNGMGASVFAPDDEYDSHAARLLSDSREIEDVVSFAQSAFPDAEPALRVAVAAAIRLFRAASTNTSGH